jgi:Ni,Fe-hydrogenase maturation factor
MKVRVIGVGNLLLGDEGVGARDPGTGAGARPRRVELVDGTAGSAC